MVCIEYNPRTGLAIRDGDIEAEIVLIKKRIKLLPEDYTRIYATDNIFRALRLEVARGNIKHDSIVFTYQGWVSEIDQDGNYINPPKGFLSTAYNISKALLEQQWDNAEKRKEI